MSRSLHQARTLIVPGLHNSPDGHWQTWLQSQLAESGQCIERVEQADWSTPELATWGRAVLEAIERSPEPVWIVAHSFGCLATVWALQRLHGRYEKILGVLLVAAADPDKFQISRPLRGFFLPVPSLIIASTTDPWLSIDKAYYWANEWGCELINVGPAGHINIASGHGPWPEGLALFKHLQASTRSLRGLTQRHTSHTESVL